MFEQDFFKQLQTMLSRPYLRLVLWISSQNKVLIAKNQLDWCFKNKEVESKSSNILYFCYYRKLTLVQILCVLKRKETIFKGDYGNSSLAKKLLLIQLKNDGNIWIMNPKQRAHNESTYRHWTVLADRFPIIQQTQRKFVLENRLLRSQQIQGRAELYTKLLIYSWQSVCKYIVHS